MQPHIQLKPSDNTGVTISATTGTTLPTPDNNVVSALLTIKTANVYMRWDGTVPAQTGVDGAQLMEAGQIYEVVGRDILVAMNFVPVSADAFVQVSYMKGE